MNSLPHHFRSAFRTLFRYSGKGQGGRNGFRHWVILPILALALSACSTMPKPSPGMSALYINIRAEPKAGYKPPMSGSSEYGGDDLHEVGPFSRFDYGELGEIVVWLDLGPETSGDSQSPVSRTINVASPPQSIVALSEGSHLTIRNNGSKPDRFLLRYQAGGITDLGKLAPGASVEHTLATPGPTDLVSDLNDQTLCTIFVTSGSPVQITSSRKPVIFNNLAPGEYRANCWHPRLPGSSTNVKLTPDTTQKVTLTVGVNALPKVPRQ